VVIDMINDDERERRQRLIANLREQNSARTVELRQQREADALAEIMSRPVEHRNDKDRREIEERDAQWAREREAESERQGEAVVFDRAEIDGALVSVPASGEGNAAGAGDRAHEAAGSNRAEAR
jgi:hypothetical protein